MHRLDTDTEELRCGGGAQGTGVHMLANLQIQNMKTILEYLLTTSLPRTALLVPVSHNFLSFTSKIKVT